MMINLLHGRCEDLFQHIPDKSIDAVIADIPYGTTECKWDTPIDLDVMWRELKRVRKDRTPIVLFAQTPFDKLLGYSNIKELRYEWIYEKTNGTGFLNAKKMPLKCHENILVFYKKLPTYNPQKTDGAPRKSAMRGDVNSEVYGRAKKRTWYDSTTRYPRDVQKFKKDKQTSSLHPTQKPLELNKYLVRTYTNPGDHVLDFTMGSGTMGVACKELGRNFTGIEKELDIFITAKERIEND
jgi:site-specific DNA-methyltransferase (adenine-specific)